MTRFDIEKAQRGPRGLVAVPLIFEARCAGRGAEPVATGVPFPRGTLWRPEALALTRPDGGRAPLQAEALARWPDGSVKWLLVDSLMGPGEGEGGPWTLRDDEGDGQGPADPRPIAVVEAAGGVAVDTGAATFRVGRDGRSLLRGAVAGRDVAGPARVTLTDREGRSVPPAIDAVAVESRGPVRATVRLEGAFPGRARCRFSARLCFFAGTGLVRVRLTVHNPERARHPGGLWDLGDPGSIFFRDLSMELELAGAGEPLVAWADGHGRPHRRLAGARLEVYQDSSGGPNWDGRNHVNREGRVPCRFPGYRAHGEGWEEAGRRASPSVSLRGAGGSLAAAIPEFWEQFPKALEVEGRRLRLRPFPGQFGDLFELQGGERKTHTLWLEFGPAGAADDEGEAPPLAWVHRPARARATPEWAAESGALPGLTPAEDDPTGRLGALLAGVVEGEASFFARREIIDEYGWRHFGEVYADHEAAYYRGEPPVVSHYNNQYDAILGMTLQYLRTGDARWFDLLDPLARHVMDIDIYHTDRDKAGYNGGLFWHTDHYRDAATCTHRAFSRANCRPGDRSYGGGPCAEHNYTTGLLHYYYLTGDRDARAAVIGLADWVVDMEDGRKSILRWVDRGPTGLASCTAEPGYHGPGRGCGNSINALLDGWLLSGERRYLEEAEALIRRSIHPADDVEARNLLVSELRWSYTVFLATLDRYLRLKAEAGETGFMYAYARAGLVRYATWMLEREVPYFDRPEALEYPTETWAAQDLRKANVLRLAAAYVDEPARSRLLARGDEFAERAWADLSRFESRALARPVAILMREGTRDASLRVRPPDPAPPPDGAYDFGEPQAFVGQKERVLSRVRAPRDLARALARLARTAVGGREP